MKTFQNWKGIFFLVLLTIIGGCNEEEVLPKNELVAIAGADIAIEVNQEVLLDGSASHDKKNEPFSYKWTIKAQPVNSGVVLTNSSAAKANFKADVAGNYIVELQIKNGRFSASDEVMITVTSSEPVAVILNENITADKILVDIFEDPTKPDYIVINDIEVRADLEIMPGVVVAFQQDKGLQFISGVFKAIGNANQGITFKGLVNTPGYWKGIVVYSNALSNTIDYVTIMQAGSSVFQETGVKANLTLAGAGFSGASLKINHTVFSGSGGYGLYVQGMSTLTQFADNTFVNNAKAAAFISANQLHKIDAVSFSNTNGLETGGLVLEQGDITWKKLTTGAYHVTSDIHIKTGVTVDAGASFRMNTGVGIDVSDGGYLSGNGTADNNVNFSAATIGTYWNGILFNSWNVNNKLAYCEITNAGMNKLGDAEFKANIVIGSQGLAAIENCVIKNGLGYGVVASSIDRINDDIVQINHFENLSEGKVYPLQITEPNTPPLTGVWLDQWSFNQGAASIAEGFYDVASGQWFSGFATPWAMDNAGFGIRFDENGTFTWLIAEHSPWIGCVSYSAEYIIGKATITPQRIVFDQEYWRSKFYNSCDESQNVDTGVTPFVLDLPYTINKKINVMNGAEYWELKFTNPDNSTFSFYRY